MPTLTRAEPRRALTAKLESAIGECREQIVRANRLIAHCAQELAKLAEDDRLEASESADLLAPESP